MDLFLRSWPFDPWIIVPILVTAGIYVRGWMYLQARTVRFGYVQLCSFLGGLCALFLALASPIEPFSFLLLQVHMVQHLLLMMAAPPLIWLGEPMLPLLRGLPREVRRQWLGPLFRLHSLRNAFRFLTQPKVAWVPFLAATWIWHVPGIYELALRSDAWHYLEHACFLVAALLFWYPVVQPFPARPLYSRWLLIPYLMFTDIQNTALSALLTFSGSVLYPHYDSVPRVWGISALDDQSTAGVIMWVPGSVVYLVPLVWIAHGLLHGSASKKRRSTRPLRESAALAREETALTNGSAYVPRSPSRRIELPVVTSKSTAPDVLNLPAVGRFLKWRHARTAMQIPLFVLGLAVIVDGLTGPQLESMNLAGVLPWIHWRGLVVLALLVGGNFFCMACPFMLPRGLAKRWLPAGMSWPRRLRSKWLAVGLLVLFFWAYEAFSLWASPWWTAWITLAYFLAAFVIDGFFRGAAFCKYVCPIGQFNFVQSLVSPLEVTVRALDTCLQCVTKDCIRGGSGIPGCELHLFQPRKAGNMDCTFCLDCVHSCPHDNVGILAVMPGADLLRDPHRSGVGRFGRRPDLAALVLVLVFAAFANAAGMTAPVVSFLDQASAKAGLSSPMLMTSAFLLVAMILLPLFLVGSTSVLSHWWGGGNGRLLETVARFSFALVPLGFGMWLAHYSFHFLNSADAVVPALQRFAQDMGVAFLGEPSWGCCCCAKSAEWVLRLEILFLDAGLLLSLHLAYRLSLDRRAEMMAGLKTFAPWAALMVLLFAVGIWILFQPMDMRGAMQG